MEELTEQQIKEKIAYDYSQRFKQMYPDCWQYACNVYEHFQQPISPTNAKWLMDRQDYEQYQEYF